jgi:hypothetical protein
MALTGSTTDPVMKNSSTTRPRPARWIPPLQAHLPLIQLLSQERGMVWRQISAQGAQIESMS